MHFLIGISSKLTFRTSYGKKQEMKTENGKYLKVRIYELAYSQPAFLPLDYRVQKHNIHYIP